MSWDPAADAKETMDLIHKLYLEQKDAEDASGIDTSRDRARMDQWIQDVKDGEGGLEELDKRFPEVRDEHHMCPKCKGDGMFFTQNARKRVTTKTGTEIVEVPGMVFCKCPAGQNKYVAVRTL
jgi:hypothetical protein